MKNIGIFLLLTILPAPAFLHAQQSNTPPFDELIPKATEFVSALEKGDYGASVKHFDATMAKAAPPEKMKQIWEMVLSQVGPFKMRKGVWSESLPGYDIVYVTCEFEKATLDIKMVFNKNKKIAGQFFVPPKPTEETILPEYVKRDSFSETEVEIGVQGWEVPGTLSLPDGNGPYPALVLVHGSGPNDRDESLGPNKPFKDLAWGLASQNIAVLRYDKRTKVHGRKMVSEKNLKLTVYEESIEDALYAANLLRNTDDIDAGNVFFLGHSLGGMLIPRIADEDLKARGFIIMAGPARPLEDLFVEQIAYISLLDGKLSEEEKTQLEQITSDVQRIKGFTPETADKMPGRFLGAGADYWLDLKGYDPARAAQSIDRPILIIQGGRDYQVTLEDFEIWKKALSDKNTVQFKLYPAHNHLMIPGKGKCTPEEYQKAGHVDKMVIDDIVKWIEKMKR